MLSVNFWDLCVEKDLVVHDNWICIVSIFVKNMNDTLSGQGAI